jgi:hypothetical protein
MQTEGPRWLKTSNLNIPEHRNIAHWETDQKRVVRFKPGSETMAEMTVPDYRTGSPRRIQVLRVFLTELDGASGLWEMNLAAKRAMVALKTILSDPRSYDIAWEVTRQGRPPTTVWSFTPVK